MKNEGKLKNEGNWLNRKQDQ